MVLETLLGPDGVAPFLANHYAFLPFARPGGARAFTGLATPETVDALLAVPGADVLVSREGRIQPLAQPLVSAEARRLHAEGCTLTVREAQKQHARLGDLAAEFEADLGAPVDVHVYATPAAASGFGWHLDAEDVFILQTRGTKRYWLRNNTVHPLPTRDAMPRRLDFSAEVTPTRECLLGAGDLLYIPPGCWHVARAEDDSISLSIGLMTATPLDVLDFLRARLAGRIAWRRRLPVAGRAAADRYRAELQDLVADLQAFASAELARDFLAGWGARLRARASSGAPLSSSAEDS